MSLQHPRLDKHKEKKSIQNRDIYVTYNEISWGKVANCTII